MAFSYGLGGFFNLVHVFRDHVTLFLTEFLLEILAAFLILLHLALEECLLGLFIFFAEVFGILEFFLKGFEFFFDELLEFFNVARARLPALDFSMTDWGSMTPTWKFFAANACGRPQKRLLTNMARMIMPIRLYVFFDITLLTPCMAKASF